MLVYGWSRETVEVSEVERGLLSRSRRSIVARLGAVQVVGTLLIAPVSCAHSPEPNRSLRPASIKMAVARSLLLLPLLCVCTAADSADSRLDANTRAVQQLADVVARPLH